MLDKVGQMILFVCLVNLTPNFEILYTFFMTDRLYFTKTDLGNYQTFGTICYVLGLLMFSLFFVNVQPKKFYMITNFLLFFVTLSFLLVCIEILEDWGINEKLFCYLS